VRYVLTMPAVPEVPVKRAMISVRDQVILTADVDRFSGVGVAEIREPADLDLVVTNPRPPAR
jgi:DeoR/GlpR family transcriptional regulator of sugar metabolism